MLRSAGFSLLMITLVPAMLFASPGVDVHIPGPPPPPSVTIHADGPGAPHSEGEYRSSRKGDNGKHKGQYKHKKDKKRYKHDKHNKNKH